MTADSALKLSAWIALNEPQLFTELLRRVPPRQGPLGSLGDDGFDLSSLDWGSVNSDLSAGMTPIDSSSFTMPDYSAPYMPASDFTSVADLQSLDPNQLNFAVPQWDASQLNLPDFSSPPDLYAGSTLGTPFAGASSVPPAGLPSAGLPSAGSGGSQSWLTSLGSGLAGAVKSVAGAIGSPQGLQAVGQVASAVINSNTQQQVLAAQTQRAAIGQAPAPVTYATTATGQRIPVVVNPATGQVAYSVNGQPYVANKQVLAAGPGASIQQLTSSLGPYGPYILIGGGLLLLLLLTNRG